MRTRNAEKEELVKKMTVQMIVANGVENFSVNSLAKACGISVATLYIYYKDKDDLIVQVGIDEGTRLSNAVLKDFDPEQSFETGLRKQWENRAGYQMANPLSTQFMEKLHMSSYADKISAHIADQLVPTMRRFVENALARKEMKSMPIEVWWSLAFGPLYSLLRYHHQGSFIAGKPFSLNEEILWQTFDSVLKSLKP
ncbi:TetR/AcrR family transcriptional regulator [Chitinophaga flava]|uniref:TetR/AcrR family transcriptional regulator n=1 Tax=Chitinophaga flava TaxID=2259036 RepID=A0A365XPL2_9BACT|nr:TetR/AcrR family transcriptional regulator [Chitinophaga flava]RBL88080.1 TetR/AcrR family transcriptional regulator [Chitinophaga flava]